MPAIAPIHHILDGSIHAIAICLNLCLLVVIYNTHNDMLKRYKNVFLLTCASDLVCAVITFLSSPAFFVNGNLAVMLSNGLLSRIPSDWTLVMLVAYNAIMAANMVFLPVPFVYRYWNMCRNDNAKWLLAKICVVPTVVSLVSTYTAYNMMSCDRQFQVDAAVMVRSLLWTNNKESIVEDRLFGFRIALDDLSMMPHVALVGVINVLGYACIVWSELGVFRKMNLSANLMRKSTRKLQAGLHKALIALAICPVLSSLVPVGSFLLALVFKVDLSNFSPFLLIFVSSITVVNPITTCYFVKSFRDTLLRLLCLGRIMNKLKSSVDFDATKITVF